MQNKKQRIRRFDIYLYDFGSNSGSIQNGVRPVLTIQDERFNDNSPTVIIAAITSAVKKSYLPSHVFIGEQFGLTKPSMVLLEQIRTVNKNELSSYIGHVDDKALIRQLARGIKKTFGLWSYTPKSEDSIRCLCPACVKNYMDSGKYIVRRLDPFQKEKETCDRCEGLGWDYVVLEKTAKQPATITDR